MARKCGFKVCFHGGYAKKSDAIAKAKAKGGRVLGRFVPGSGFRWVVVTKKRGS